MTEIGITEDDTVQIHGEERRYHGRIERIMSDGRLMVWVNSFDIESREPVQRSYGNGASECIIDGDIILHGYADKNENGTWTFLVTEKAKVDPDYVTLWEKR